MLEQAGKGRAIPPFGHAGQEFGEDLGFAPPLARVANSHAPIKIHRPPRGKRGPHAVMFYRMRSSQDLDSLFHVSCYAAAPCTDHPKFAFFYGLFPRCTQFPWGNLLAGLEEENAMAILARMNSPWTLVAGLLIAAAVAFARPDPAPAQALERIGDFKDWSAFTTGDGGSKVCFMSSQPLRDYCNDTTRAAIYTFVTHRPSEGRVGEVNVKPGYTYQDGSYVDLSIDGQKFQLVTQEGNAWPHAPETDKKIIQAMIKGSSMIVRGTSSKGTLTTDTYSLLGFTNAYQAISRACGVN